MGLEEFLNERPATPLRALVVDDDRIFRRVIVEVMSRQGYETLEGENGDEAIELCVSNKPDILVIDVSMPVRDGISAVRAIKHHLPEHYMPVIFITAADDENMLAQCIVAGGDEFISKPFNPTLLQAKLIAIERNRAMYMALNDLHNNLQRDQEIAEQVFSKAVISPNIDYPGLTTFIRPASTFSGDVLLTAARPNGDLNILLGDFTGHGLSAAIGAMPVSDTFRAMTGKGYSGAEIVHQISKKLCSMLPTGMFFSSALATISHEYKTVSVWNAGLPDIWLFSTDPVELKHRFTSKHPPLGIVTNSIEDLIFDVIDLSPGDTIIMCSDGLLEARSELNEYFGEARYLQTIEEGLRQGNVAEHLTETLDSFVGHHIVEDDVTFAEIPFDADSITELSLPTQITTPGTKDHRWEWRIRLEDQMLRKTDLVPLVMNQLRELLTDNDNLQQVYTVFTELYLNALEHGILGLPSSLKSDAAGFAKYFSEKEKRMKAIASGWIDVKLRYESGQNFSQILIEIRDSGAGFDVDDWMKQLDTITNQLSGRGLKLVMEMTDELSFLPPGNHVIAVMEWKPTEAT